MTINKRNGNKTTIERGENRDGGGALLIHGRGTEAEQCRSRWRLVAGKGNGQDDVTVAAGEGATITSRWCLSRVCVRTRNARVRMHQCKLYTHARTHTHMTTRGNGWRRPLRSRHTPLRCVLNRKIARVTTANRPTAVSVTTVSDDTPWR